MPIQDFLSCDIQTTDDLAQHYLVNMLDPNETCRDARGWSARSGPQIVYAAYDDDGNILYVGITGNEGNRLSSHVRGSKWWDDMVFYRHWKVCCRRHGLDLETRLIHLMKPPHNTVPAVAASRMSRMFESFEVIEP